MEKKARSNSSAAKKIAGNIYMLWEILIRLPSKSLIRLKYVSKQWQTLISDQQFSDSHFDHHHHDQCNHNSLIFSNGYGHERSHILSFNTTTTLTPTPRVLNLDFLNQSGVGVIQSCNGLLLCCCRWRLLASPYFIYNPITRDFTTLNLSRHPCRRDKIIRLYLAFDPSISPHYKVVTLAVNLNSPLDWVFHVYTFKTRSRIGPGVSISTPFALDAANGVYYNGAIHWCSKSKFCFYFDVDTLCFRNYPMPLSRFRNSRYFGESGGRLHLILPFNGTCYDIFQLKQDYSGWSSRHRIDLNLIQVEFPHIKCHWHHVGFYIFHTPKDEKKKSSISVLIVGNEGAISHDPLNKTSKKLCDFEMDTPTSLHIRNSLAGRDHNRVHQHFENLC